MKGNQEIEVADEGFLTGLFDVDYIPHVNDLVTRFEKRINKDLTHWSGKSISNEYVSES